MTHYTQKDGRSAAEIYSALRALGRVILAASDASKIGGVRKLARADDLIVVQRRARPVRSERISWQDHRPYTLELTDEKGWIVAPDSN